MDIREIETLNDQAVGCYVEGRYDEARRAWEEILGAAPGDSRALEGVQLLGALAGRGGPPLPAAIHDDLPSERPVMRPEEIEDLLRSGRYRDALNAAKDLERSSPGNSLARRLLESAMAKLEAEPFIAGEIARAREALASGDTATAREALRAVLALDPTHPAALDLQRGSGEPAGRPKSARAHAAPPVSAPFDPPVELTEELAEIASCEQRENPPEDLSEELPEDLTEELPADLPHAARGVSAPMADGALAGPGETTSMAGVEIHADDEFSAGIVGEIEAMGQTLAQAPKAEDAPEPPDFMMDFGDVADAEASGPAKTSGSGPTFVTAREAGHGSIFEAPDEEVLGFELNRKEGEATAPGGMEPAGADDASFADIEAEIGESLGTPPVQGGMDFDIGKATSAGGIAPQPLDPPLGTPQGSASPVAAGAPPPIAQDLSFEDDFAAFSEAEGADAIPSASTPVGAAAVPQARVAALLEESQRFLHAGRFSDAIESGARALAIDADCERAQALIEEARSLRLESDHRAEEALDEARRKLDARDLPGAESLFLQVLGTHPTHSEALEGLETIGRIRKEKQPQPAEPSRSQAREQESEKILTVPLAQSRPIEPLTPKPHAGPRPADLEEEAEFSTDPPKARTAPKLEMPSRRRLYVYGAVAAGLIVFTVGATWLVGKLAAARPSDLKPVKLDATEKPGRPAGAAGVHKTAVTAPVVPAPKPVDPGAGYERTYTVAKQLVGDGKLDAARAVLTDIVRTSPGDTRSAALLESVQSLIFTRDKRNDTLAAIRSAFLQDRYEDALRLLYRLPPEMQKGDVHQMMADAWYNDGVGYLTGGNCTEAVRCFDEVLQLAPKDSEARRLRDFAKGYSGREKDADYLRFVSNIKNRPFPAN